jgi:hypothetical protein
MTTLIAVYDNYGCVGRCDSRCYSAHEPQCDCICGGRNHGVGLERAVDNTRQMAEEWIQAYTREHHLRGDARWEIPAKKPVQLAFL